MALATQPPLPDHNGLLGRRAGTRERARDAAGLSDRNFFFRDETVFAMTILRRICPRARVVIATLLLALTALGGAARAQAPPPPPGPPPLTQPSVPILPGAPSALIAVPAAVSTPLQTPVAIPTSQPTPGPRLFNCSCFTTGSATQWSGFVNATNYSTARSAASGACSSYLTRGAQSPFIPPGQSPGLGSSTNNELPGTVPSGSSSNPQPPGTASSTTPSSQLANSPSLTGQTACNLCACN